MVAQTLTTATPLTQNRSIPIAELFWDQSVHYSELLGSHSLQPLIVRAWVRLSKV